MEDAMIINKASEERGLAHGSIYKSEFLVLKDKADYFCRNPNDEGLVDLIDSDGLPYHGREMKDDTPLYSYYSPDQSKFIVAKFSGKEACYVHSVKMCGQIGAKARRMACITFRIPVSFCLMLRIFSAISFNNDFSLEESQCW